MSIRSKLQHVGMLLLGKRSILTPLHKLSLLLSLSNFFFEKYGPFLQ